MLEILIVILLGQVLILIGFIILAVAYVRVRREKDNDNYIDYFHRNLVLRIYKPEFEHVAIKGIPRDSILDIGTFSPYYKWILFQK